MRFWLVRETEKARLYSKVDPSAPNRIADEGDQLWIPKSVIEHTTKRGSEHEVKLPDWFIEKNEL
jgi:hypothetical protein